MTGPAHVVERLAGRVKLALEAADLDAYEELLDPGVRWGLPGDPALACQNRDQVLAWYRRGREAGTRARVTETLVRGDQILVGLTVTGRPAADTGGEADRWQVLTVRDGRVAAISGFDDRAGAAAWAGLAPAPPTRRAAAKWAAPRHRLADDRIEIRLPEPATPASCIATPRGRADWTGYGCRWPSARAWLTARRWSATGWPGGITGAASRGRR